jgi:hypothetical protein
VPTHPLLSPVPSLFEQATDTTRDTARQTKRIRLIPFFIFLIDLLRSANSPDTPGYRETRLWATDTQVGRSPRPLLIDRVRVC